ncbi:MAG TPA: hypothetical protein VFK69_11075 [Candidatus Eisenbacteria bacterium]|nr:hypothetical protein [Candidatus Eisenbacteria bacterium]
MSAASEVALFGRVRTPSFASLRDVLARLARAGFQPALGGSALLAHLSLLEGGAVHDWDLTVDAPAREVWGAVRELEPRYAGSGGRHADEKLMLPSHALEIICGFAFHTPAGIVRIPARIGAVAGDVPFASPEAWLVAYTLLERESQAAALRGWLERAGADPDAIARLCAQPLAPKLATELRALPLRGAR